jgi:hypothetical protein
MGISASRVDRSIGVGSVKRRRWGASGLRVAVAGAIVMRVTLELQPMALHWTTAVVASL